jgi:hypothetical protein
VNKDRLVRRLADARHAVRPLHAVEREADAARVAVEDSRLGPPLAAGNGVASFAEPAPRELIFVRADPQFHLLITERVVAVAGREVREQRRGGLPSQVERGDGGGL